jgi:hypothetical protein
MLRRKHCFIILIIVFLLSLSGCASFSRKYNSNHYRLKEKIVKGISLPVEVDSISMKQAFSYCSYRHFKSRLNSTGDTTYVYNVFPAGKVRLAIIADPNVPKNILFKWPTDYLYPDSLKKKPISVEAFHRVHFGFKDATRFYKLRTTAEIDSLEGSLFLDPIYYKKNIPVYSERVDGSAVYFSSTLINPTYYDMKEIVKQQITNNSQLIKSSPQGKIVISFTHSFRFGPNFILTLPETTVSVFTFGIANLLGFPFMTYNGKAKVKAEVKNADDITVKEYTESVNYLSFAANYWGYSYDMFGQAGAITWDENMYRYLDNGMMRNAYSGATITAINKVLKHVMNDSAEIDMLLKK